MEDIRPARKLKISPKNRKEEPVINKVQPKVVEDVAPPEEIPETPNEEAVRIIARVNEAKNNFLVAMKNFNKILQTSILPENRTEQQKNEEVGAINYLLETATIVENYSSSKEGVLGLGVFAVRQALILRDAGNRLAYKVQQLENKLKQIEKDIYEED